MRSLLKVLLDKSDHGRVSLIWGIRQVIEEHKYNDDLQEIEQLIVNPVNKYDIDRAKFMCEEFLENQYLMPYMVRMMTLLDFLEDDREEEEQ